LCVHITKSSDSHRNTVLCCVLLWS